MSKFKVGDIVRVNGSDVDLRVVSVIGDRCCAVASHKGPELFSLKNADLVLVRSGTAHPHAAAMAEYAKDAAETDAPWERWQYRDETATPPMLWYDLGSHPAWSLSNEYRRKPRDMKTVLNVYKSGAVSAFACKDNAVKYLAAGMTVEVNFTTKTATVVCVKE